MKLLTTDYPSSATVGHYQIDSGRRMRIEEYQGRTGLADLKSIITAMTSDPCWSADFHGLIDFSQAELELTANEVLRFALVLRHESHRTRGWLAFVTANTTTYGIIRMLGYWSRTTERTRIFQSREAAEAWLELNIDQIPPGFIEAEGMAESGILRTAV